MKNNQNIPNCWQDKGICWFPLVLSIFLTIVSGISFGQAPDTALDIRSLTELNGKALPRESVIQKLIQASQNPDSKLVPAVEALLINKELSHAARYFLERSYDPLAGKALRSALSKTADPELLVGLLNSIGMKEDATDVDAVAPFLKKNDPRVIHSAALCLGKIADEKATKTLMRNWQESGQTERTQLAFGMTTLGHRLIQKGDRKGATLVFQTIRGTKDLPVFWIAAADETLLELLDGSEKTALIQSLATSKDSKIVRVLFSAGRKVKDRSEFNSVIIDNFNSFANEQTAALTFLAETNTLKIRSFLLKIALESASGSVVKSAALSGLGAIGDLAVAQALLNKNVTQETLDAVAVMTDPAIDGFILGQIKADDKNQIPALLDLAARRKIGSGTAFYRRSLDSADPAIQQAAVHALAATGSIADLPKLLDKMDQNGGSDRIKAARTIVLRSNEREAAVESLVANVVKMSESQQIELLDLLGEIRGGKALETVLKLVQSSQPVVVDNAVRVLAAWKSQDAAPYLFYLAERHPNAKYRIRALRGYARLLKLSTDDSGKRLELCKKAFQLATRLEERALIIEAMGRIPTEEALREIVRQFDNNELRGYAYHSSVDVIEKLPGARSEYAEKTLQKVYDITINKDLKARIAKLKQK